ncbi:MAG: TIGR02281 family clan AA aspartic protease [Gammaproteobacteria bacterium]
MGDDDGTEVGLPLRVGRGMLLVFWALLLLLLFFYFQSVLERAANPNREVLTTVTAQGVKEVELQRNRQGHYLATGAINGYPVTFLLDTGATDVAVSGGLAATLGLRRGMPITSQTANGTVTAWQTELAEVSIGDIRLRNVRASILPGLQGDEVLLGMSFLKQLELVQRGKHLLLRQK